MKILEKEIVIIVGRTPDMEISRFFSLVEKIKNLGVKPIPLIFPFHYNLMHMNWSNGNYDMKEVMRSFRNEVRMDDLPLLVIGENGIYTSIPYLCCENSKVCFLSEESKLEEVLSILLKY